VKLPSHTCDDFRQSLDIFQRRAEIHDAGAQRKLTLDDSIRQERFAAAFDLRKNCGIQAIEIVVSLTAFAQIRWNISKWSAIRSPVDGPWRGTPAG